MNGLIGNDELQQDGTEWELRLYIAGQSTRSAVAFANLKKICNKSWRAIPTSRWSIF